MLASAGSPQVSPPVDRHARPHGVEIRSSGHAQKNGMIRKERKDRQAEINEDDEEVPAALHEQGVEAASLLEASGQHQADAQAARQAQQHQLVQEFLSEDFLEEDAELLDKELIAHTFKKKSPPARRRSPCKWHNWGEWGECSTTCGEGEWVRYRGKTMEHSEGLPCHGDYYHLGGCERRKCPVACIWGEWSGLDPPKCPVECGGGIMVTTRQKISEAQHGGVPCDDPHMNMLKVTCNSEPCPVDCDFTPWTSWTICSLSCGGGVKERSRDKLHSSEAKGAYCDNKNIDEEHEPCNTQPCPIDCQVGVWTEWTACTKDCGGGETTRIRPLLVKNIAGGQTCPHTNETIKCQVEPCGKPFRATAQGLPGSLVWSILAVATAAIYI